MVDRPDLNPTQLARVGGICAIAAAVLTILNGFVLAPGGPADLGLPAAQIVSTYSGHQSLNEVGAFLDAVGAGLPLLFVVTLGRLAAPRGSLFSSAAALMAAVFFASDVLWAAAEFAFNYGTQQNTDPNASKALLLLSQAMLVAIAIPIALQYAAMGLLIVQTRVVPIAMGWIAIATGAVALASVFLAVPSGLGPVGFAAYLLTTIAWPAAAGILLLVRRPSVTPAFVAGEGIE
jgi:hypothetical protein